MGIIIPFRKGRVEEDVGPKVPRSSSSLLMVAHPQGVPYVTNNPEVAAMLQLEEEIRYRGRYDINTDLQTQIMPAVRERLVVDFGGSTCAVWRQAEILLMDGSEVVFWPHQFEAVFAAVEVAQEKAKTQGYGILPDVFCPAALSEEDLSAVHQWMELNAEDYLAIGMEQIESYQQARLNMVLEGSNICMPEDRLADNFPADIGFRQLSRGPEEVQ